MAWPFGAVGSTEDVGLSTLAEARLGEFLDGLHDASVYALEAASL
jgi:hypothetical protein